LIKTACKFDVPVLITGESGTGKELAARAIHQGSVRADEPFVAMNCGAIPDGLVESELFGHAKGAFTGAVVARDGAFAQASGGTILLDEISEFRLDLQVKLLRVLQEKRVLPLGAKADQTVDVRVLACANRTLGEEIDGGRFRSDLYYRLAVFPIHLPPLREREGDVLLLGQSFLDEFASTHQRGVQGFAPDAIEALENWVWPGNVRELRNVVERAVILSSGEEVGAHALPIEVQNGAATELTPAAPPAAGRPAAAMPATMTDDPEPPRDEDEIIPLVDEERRVISRALGKGGWKVPDVAKRLGMSRATLYRKIRKLGIQRPGTHHGDY